MSNEAHKYFAALGVLLIILCIVCAPSLTRRFNEWQYEIQKVDDTTSYRTRKTVEDSCRAMIASYTADIATYNMYKDSDNEEKQSWAEQARMRANRTAANYNEYILKNSFVWDGNIPSDIDSMLPMV